MKLKFMGIALMLAAGCAFPARADSVLALVDLPGSSWRNASPRPEIMRKHSGLEPRRVSVHFTDIKKNPRRSLAQKMRTLFHYSITTIAGPKKRLWGDLPYHFFLDLNGKVAEGRDPAYQPDSNTTYKLDGHVTIVLEGNNSDGITSAQKQTLFKLIDALRNRYNVPVRRVGVHKDYAETDCPSSEITAAVREYVRSRGGSGGPPEGATQPTSQAPGRRSAPASRQAEPEQNEWWNPFRRQP